MRAKPKTLTDALADISRDFGAGSVLRGLGGQTYEQATGVVPSGSEALDAILGGGWPRGRVVELFGAENAGKTTIALHAVAEAQKQGLQCVFVDTECSLDPKYAQTIGVNTDELLYVSPDSAEQALEVMQRLVSSGGIGMVVLDSIAALVTRAELCGEMGDLGVGGKARLLGQAVRKLVPAAKQTDTLLFLVNQNREAIGGYGPAIVQPGGRAVKYAAAIRADVKRGQPAKRAGADPHKQSCSVKTAKNKMIAPLKEAEFWIEYGVGIRDKAGRNASN